MTGLVGRERAYGHGRQPMPCLLRLMRKCVIKKRSRMRLEELEASFCGLMPIILNLTWTRTMLYDQLRKGKFGLDLANGTIRTLITCIL